ncbi:unnamed protein product [Caenorhabditis angaria]|uniref:Uncharacterized protein n=1 Tax=Caenorhabditis angaria TaxID=860376 RepID=A0A9P1IC75_9PELO|nr:unnamed protein product [Caenorhabditis angaria]
MKKKSQRNRGSKRDASQNTSNQNCQFTNNNNKKLDRSKRSGMVRKRSDIHGTANSGETKGKSNRPRERYEKSSDEDRDNVKYPKEKKKVGIEKKKESNTSTNNKKEEQKQPEEMTKKRRSCEKMEDKKEEKEKQSPQANDNPKKLSTAKERSPAKMNEEGAKDNNSGLDLTTKEPIKPVKMDDGYEDFGPGA